MTTIHIQYTWKICSNFSRSKFKLRFKEKKLLDQQSSGILKSYFSDTPCIHAWLSALWEIKEGKKLKKNERFWVTYTTTVHLHLTYKTLKNLHFTRARTDLRSLTNIDCVFARPSFDLVPLLSSIFFAFIRAIRVYHLRATLEANDNSSCGSAALLLG